MERLLTAEEVADILRISERSVKYRIGLTYYKIQNKRLYKQSDVDNYIKKNRTYCYS